MKEEELIYEEMTGIKDGYSADIVRGYHRTRVEIFSEDLDINLPNLAGENWTPQMVNDAIYLFETGMRIGEHRGREGAQREFRRVLGLDNLNREEES